MSIPKEPRQQMINIMYLVLIALLALNVSNEIVNAFKVLDDGIQASNQSIDNKLVSSFKSFDKAVEKNPDGQVYLDRARQAETYSNDFIKFIDGIRTQIIDEAGGLDTEAENPADRLWPKKLDEQAIPTRIMVEEGKGQDLDDKISEYREKFLALFDGEEFEEGDKEAFASQVLLASGEKPAGCDKPDWATCTFNQMPLVSVITLLDKYKNDAKNSASAAVDRLKAKVSEEEILFDNLEAVIVPLSGTKLITGETFEAEVFLSSSSSASTPSISVNGRGLPVTGGKAKFTAKATTVGEKTLNAKITSKDGFGKEVTRDTKLSYSVVNPPDHVAIVSPTKMNVFYIGVDNPVSCAVTGIRDDQVKVNMNGGTIRKASGAGNYTVTVTKQGKATVSLSGPKRSGGTFNGSAEFRVKRIPDPIVMIGKKKPGPMKSGEIKAQQGLRAVLENFDFEAKFNVLSYEVCLAGQGDLLISPNNGAKWSGTAGKYVKQVKPGNIIYFDKIKAKGPDGITRDLGSVAYRIL